MRQTIILLSAALLFSACANDEAQIRQCAQGYLEAMGNYRPTEARQYATQQTCDVTLSFFEKVMEFTDSSVYANNIPAEITQHLRDAGKIAVLMGSLCAGILGSVLITFVHKIQARKAA